MKPIAEFLSELRRLQIKIWIDEGRLRSFQPRVNLHCFGITPLPQKQAT